MSRMNLPRFTTEQVEEIKDRHARGEKVTDLAEAYGRGYDVIRGIVKGRTYRKYAASAPTCNGCAQGDRAASNMVLSHQFRGDVECVAGCGRTVETSVNIVRSRQGRIRCPKCSEVRP